MSSTAILERLALKRKVFADLDKFAPAHAILATNSSMIVSSKIADATNRPAQVCNLHFFNPALVMKLVEVVQGPHVSDETAQISMQFCEKISKRSHSHQERSLGIRSEQNLLGNLKGIDVDARNGRGLLRRYRQGLRIRCRPFLWVPSASTT